jgi:ribonuclease P/MRP protein subunit RPP40
MCQPRLIRAEVLTPPMRLPSTDDHEEEQMQIVEWIDLVRMGSPRLDPNDKIDQYLSRYEIPDAESASVVEVVQVSWRGFVMAEWIRELYVQCL